MREFFNLLETKKEQTQFPHPCPQNQIFLKGEHLRKKKSYKLKIKQVQNNSTQDGISILPGRIIYKKRKTSLKDQAKSKTN